MCELLGMSANVPTDICFSFTGLVQRGGRTGPHTDGWGIVFYEGKGVREFRDPSPSCESEVAKLVQEYPIKSCNVVSHIRQANVGDVCLENTHPFVRELWGCNWTFAHNGQLKNSESLTLGRDIPIGTTDSERAFCWLLGKLHQEFSAMPEDISKLSDFLQEHCDQLRALGVFNMLLCNSHYLFAYCSTKLHWITRRAPFGQAQLKDTEMTVNFAGETTPNDIVTVIATEPLTDNEVWQQMDVGELLTFKEGLRITA